MAAGYALGATGGHCDETFFPPSMEEKSPALVDSPDDGRREVRTMRKYGARVIKICATGGVFCRGDSPGAQQLTLEEMKAIADEAHMADMKVAAHAHGAPGIKAAILAGIDTIEHVSLIDDEGIRLAVQQGTWLASTSTTPTTPRPRARRTANWRRTCRRTATSAASSGRTSARP